MYRGRPSLACANCRSRRIRCDLGRPGCSQCIRAKYQCPGYRDPVDVLFHNETQATARSLVAGSSSVPRKVTKQGNPSRPRGKVRGASHADSMKISSQSQPLELATIVTSIKTNSTDASPTTGVSQSWAALGSVKPPTDGLAAKIFFDEYVIDGIGYCTIDTKLAAAMRAVGLAALSNIAQDPKLMNQARKNYIAAVRLTNHAFDDIRSATDDTTLLTTLILGMFETVSGDTTASIESWSHHVQGAATLVELRGVRQLQTSLGLRLFRQVTANLFIHSIHNLTLVSPTITNLHYEAARSMDSGDLGWHTQEAFLRFANLLHKRLYDQASDGWSVISEAQAIDGALLSIAEAAGPEWQYVIWTDEADCKHYTYSNLWASQVWNVWRSIRIFVLTLIRDVLLSNLDTLPDDLTCEERGNLLETAKQTITGLRHEIMLNTPCKTVHPHDFGQARTVDAVPPHQSSLVSVQDSKRLPILRTAGNAFALWPLYSVGLGRVCPPNERDEVIELLRDVSAKTGIHQAAVFADMLDRQTSVHSNWLPKASGIPMPDS